MNIPVIHPISHASIVEYLIVEYAYEVDHSKPSMQQQGIQNYPIYTLRLCSSLYKNICSSASGACFLVIMDWAL